MADLGSRAPRSHHVQPCRVGPCAWGGEHFHHVAAAQWCAQGCGLTIDLGRHQVFAHVGVNGIGKVHWRGAARQGKDLAFRCEDVDRIRKEVDLHVLQELRCVTRVVLDVDQGLQPHCAQKLRVTSGAVFVACLVKPVRSDALFSYRMHGLGTHLEFNCRAQRAHQRGVKALVAVGLGDGNKVLETPRHGLVELVQHAQRNVTIGQRGHHDAKAKEVGDLRETRVLLAHLAIDRKHGLLAATHLNL